MPLERYVDTHHRLFKTPHFPYKRISKDSREHVILGIGGNVGDVTRRFEHLLVYLNRTSLVEVVESSIILKNPPFGYADQEDFYNAVLKITTPLRPFELLRFIGRVEKRFGRKRSFVNAPRTLDIDILFFGNRRISSEVLEIPHPRWHQRSSVLVPLLGLRGLR
jgi:2-amino-4-hydroxy-6-hydroxymethyldihydropteridine diphosphokinase